MFVSCISVGVLREMKYIIIIENNSHNEKISFLYGYFLFSN